MSISDAHGKRWSREAENGTEFQNRPRIVFVVMSAVHRATAVDQLVCALAPHTVLVHHDFSQTPDFHLAAENATFVPEPKRTGWAFFGFVDGIFHSLAFALERLEFDYLQLLSPSCLPIKPIESFEEHIQGPHDAHFGCIDLLKDPDALMSVGYRAFMPEHSLRFRLARRLSRDYFGDSTERRDVAGVWLRSGFARNASGRMRGLSRLALMSMRIVGQARLGRHPFDKDFRPCYGTTWFGARRSVVHEMVEAFRRPGVRDYFSRVRIADEFLIPTLLRQYSTAAGPMNHYIHTFDEARAGWIDDRAFDLLESSPAFFGRKFPDDPDATVRTRVLSQLVGKLADQRALS